MPTLTQEKVIVSRTTSAYLIENAGLFLWLLGSFISNKISLSLIQLLLRTNGVTTNFAGLIEAVSQKAILSNQDTQQHLTLFGIRAFTIQAVVTPSSIEEAYQAPFRSQFVLVSALLDGYGNHSFIHKPKGFFEADKAVFKTALSNGGERLCSKIKSYLALKLENNDEWEKTSVFDIVRRMTFVVLSETFLGIDSEHILKVYEPLIESLDVFERMWQNPDQFNPFVMFMLYQRLNRISNELHEHRTAAELPDSFARLHNRPMNVTAIFLVASNLVHFLTASILHQCINNHGPNLSDQKCNNLSKEVATWRFRNSRIFRFDAGLFFSNAPHHTIGGNASLPRSLTIIPQGAINHHRITTHTLLKENGHVKEPELFGRIRLCPGAYTSYSAVKSVFFAVTEKRVTFIPNEAEQSAYNRFVTNRDNWTQGRDEGDEPPVTGKWVPQMQ